MALPIRIQEPRLHRGGLESVVRPVPGSVVEWRGGIDYTPSCGVSPFIWGCDRDGGVDPDSEKPQGELEEAVFFDSVTIGVQYSCLPGSETLSPIGDLVSDSARYAYDRYRWQRLAQVLSDGVVNGAGGANPSLQSVAEVPDGFDPDAPAGIPSTIQGMLDSQCSAWDAQRVLHVPQQYLPHFLTQYLVEWDADVGVYRMGTHLVSFDCYPNLGPEGDEPAEDGSEVWMYMTDAPMAAFDSEVIESATHVRLNRTTASAESGAIIAFNTCGVVAAKALICAC